MIVKHIETEKTQLFSDNKPQLIETILNKEDYFTICQVFNTSTEEHTFILIWQFTPKFFVIKPI